MKEMTITALVLRFVVPRKVEPFITAVKEPVQVNAKSMKIATIIIHSVVEAAASPGLVPSSCRVSA